jgi:hypothetical protein
VARVTIKPVWTSSTFLQYAGMLVVVIAVAWLLDFLEGEQGTWALVGWAALFTAAALAVALFAERRAQPLLAGLVAFLTLVCFAVAVGAFFDAVGLVDEDDEGPLAEGLDFWLLVVELIVLVAALAALRRFRHPLLGLFSALTVWALVVDVLGDVFGGGDRAQPLAAIVVGLAFASRGVGMDRDVPSPSAFWVHLIAGLSVGGGVLWFLHEEDWHWVLVALVALAYVAAARRWLRSSYAVLGAMGLTAVASYFIEKWFSLTSLVPFFEAPPEDVEEWGRPLVYLGLGVVLVVLGLWVAWRRKEAPAP